MTEKKTPTRSQFHYLDFLRGLAILYIVAVRHLDDYAEQIYHTKLDDIIAYSFLGLFMFISGYLLSMNNPINNKKDLLNFAFKRFLRIYPLYVLALFLFLLCSILTFKSVLGHMLLLNIVLNDSVITLWFVSLICVFYIIYPIIVYKYSVSKTAIICIVVFLIFIFLKKVFGLHDNRLILYFPLFLFGVVSLKNELIEKYTNNKMILTCSILLFIISSFLYFELLKFRTIILMFLMMNAIPSLLLIGKFFASVLKKSIYKNIAYASFCMYLFHRVLFHIITRTYTPDNTIYTVIFLTLFAVPIIFVTSYYFQKVYDQITNRWKLVGKSESFSNP